ncbi:hypothetical protein KUTeg_023614 [Tegillarca granosa]|uniref:LITAF domain-containing protein n=2 Tax=Tegillarca granosa TaxID=220873 RepID=A0ABQ9E260_TEGGR|nr:hypothetical protein KUTeg_023614 [Tegillarca granosa]
MLEINKMSEKGPPPPAYQTGVPQAGGLPPSQPNEPPPKYEDGNFQQPTAYPPQQGYQSMAQTTVYTQQPIVLQQHIMRYGPDPQLIQCPHCSTQVTTTVMTEAGAITWLASGLICLVGCWLGCCLIPFCINDLQDVKHTCPNCNRVVGIYRRI